MDIGLPDIDGCEVTRQIRNIPQNVNSDIPIIALTAHVSEESKQKCLDVGMQMVLNKPILRDTLIDVLNRFNLLDMSKRNI